MGAGLAFTAAVGTGMKADSAVGANSMVKVDGMGKGSAAGPLFAVAADSIALQGRMAEAVSMVAAGRMAEATGSRGRRFLVSLSGWQLTLPAVFIFNP
jgi:hypothetical protein